MSKRSLLSISVIVLVLLIDQVTKILVKTHMYIGQEFPVMGDWFRIHFTENEGMAFGITFAGEYGKMALSIFRILAVGFIGYYIHLLIKKKEHIGLILSVSLIMAGALGNILDSVFYGQVFSSSYGQVAEVFPEEGGYAPVLFGHVVDMLYFPMFEGYLPEWLPFWGGDYFVFFRPVFNIADSAITVGVFVIFIFQGRFFNEKIREGHLGKDEAITTEQKGHDSTPSNKA